MARRTRPPLPHSYPTSVLSRPQPVALKRPPLLRRRPAAASSASCISTTWTDATSVTHGGAAAVRRIQTGHLWGVARPQLHRPPPAGTTPGGSCQRVRRWRRRPRRPPRRRPSRRRQRATAENAASTPTLYTAAAVTNCDGGAGDRHARRPLGESFPTATDRVPWLSFPLRASSSLTAAQHCVPGALVASQPKV